MTDDDLRAQLGKLVRQLTHEQDEGGGALSALVHEHLGPDCGTLPVLVEELAAWDLPNLQLALDAAFDRPSWQTRLVGLSGHASHYEGFGLGELLAGSNWGADVGSPEFVNAAVGPAKTMPCLALGLFLVTAPDGVFAAFVRRGSQRGFGPPTIAVEVASPADGLAVAFRAELRTLIEENDIYRGQVLTVKVDPHGGSEIVFLERPSLDASELVLPDGLLERLELHVLGPSRHRDILRAAGRHLSRGVLLWGPPGTGKTHTVRYFVAEFEEATVVILSGGALGMVSAFASLAKRLSPSLLVLEDVDLVAQERTYGPFGSSPVLFELMNEMDGLGDDADVAFVLTTNRPDALEPALAARPGRIDLAVELPLPDAVARRRLIALYARGLDLEVGDWDEVVRRTEGVTASFLKELLRRAALAAAQSGRKTVMDGDIRDVLDDLLAETARLTRVLLGGERHDDSSMPGPHEWLDGALSFELRPSD